MVDPPAGSLTVRFITAKEVIPLRAAVLRPGKLVEAAVFPGDEAPDSFHLGVFLTFRRAPKPAPGGTEAIAPHAPEPLSGGSHPFRTAKPVAVASFLRNAHPDLKAASQYQLRGMAADPAFRGIGAGKALLFFVLDHLKKRGIELLWCNAREAAIPFYKKYGFREHGTPFSIPEIGLHKVMYIFPKTDLTATTG